MSAQSSLSSTGKNSKGTGPRIKAKKSRGVGISAEPQTLQDLKVLFFNKLMLNSVLQRYI